MNKRFFLIILGAFLFLGCRSKDVVLEEKINMLNQKIFYKKTEISELDLQIKELESKKVEVAEKKELVYYIITFEAKQTHVSLDLTDHLKDAANAYTFQIPVDKDFYESVKVGQELTNNFRGGSLLLKGSLGSNKITVVEKNKVIKQ